MGLLQSISDRLGLPLGVNNTAGTLVAGALVTPAVGIFLVDLFTPLGVLAWLLSLIPLILSLWVGPWYAPLYFSLAATAGILVGGVLVPQGSIPEIGWINRAVNVAVLWIATVLLLSYRLKRQSLQETGIRLTSTERTVVDLEKRVAERTQALEEANRALQAEVTEHRLIRGWLEKSQEQLRSLANRLESVREEEAGRMAREVHDVLGQMLTALKLDVVRLSREQPDRQGPLADRLRAISAQIDTINDTVRSIATQLRPGVLHDLGLVAAIEWQAHDFADRAGLRADLHLDEQVTLEERAATVVFRIFQEVLTNIARHAGASAFRVRLWTEHKFMILEVRDNGRGISDSEIENRKSLGLLGMRERALSLGGGVMITGIPGSCTTVTVKIPLEPSQP